MNFIPVFSSLLMQVIFALLLKQTVPNSDTCYFRASVIYIYSNPMVMYELMRIRHIAPTNGIGGALGILAQPVFDRLRSNLCCFIYFQVLFFVIVL